MGEGFLDGDITRCLTVFTVTPDISSDLTQDSQRTEIHDSQSWDKNIWSWVPQGPEPRMTVLTKASSNLPDRETDRSQGGTGPDQDSQSSGVNSRSWWLTMSTEAEESPLLEAATKQQLMKM
jgi:hypothetical protein